MVLNSGYLTSTNTKNHITISISTNSYIPAFGKRTVLLQHGFVTNAFFNLSQ